MTTYGELVGGPADGVRLDPDDPSEPDDWPDSLGIGGPGFGPARYVIRSHTPTRRGADTVYLYDHEGDA